MSIMKGDQQLRLTEVICKFLYQRQVLDDRNDDSQKVESNRVSSVLSDSKASIGKKKKT